MGRAARDIAVSTSLRFPGKWQRFRGHSLMWNADLNARMILDHRSQLDCGRIPSVTDAASASTRTSKIINGSREALYRAFIHPTALVVSLPPGEMTAKIHVFDSQAGRG